MAAWGTEGGFRVRCSGQRGGLTGARVTGPHIGELSVPICLPGRNTACKGGREKGKRCAVEASEIGRGRKRERERESETKVARGRGAGTKRREVHSNQNVNYLTSR